MFCAEIFKILIVYVVKICQQSLQTASAFGRLRPQKPYRGIPMNSTRRPWANSPIWNFLVPPMLVWVQFWKVETCLCRLIAWYQQQMLHTKRDASFNLLSKTHRMPVYFTPGTQKLIFLQNVNQKSVRNPRWIPGTKAVGERKVCERRNDRQTDRQTDRRRT